VTLFQLEVAKLEVQDDFENFYVLYCVFTSYGSISVFICMLFVLQGTLILHI